MAIEELTYEQRIVEVAKRLAQLPPERQQSLELLSRSTAARELPLGVEGFRHFYWCIWRRELQPYADEWVEAFASNKWTILECFRGSGKSTDLSVTFSAYCEGKEPHTSVLVVQANDDAANKTSSLIASIIEFFEGWKMCFPNIVPDKDKGWGAKGYFVKDADYIEKNGYGNWLELCARDHLKDPSFVGAGIMSADIVGMHPHRLFFDDIHDHTNSMFPRERAKVVSVMQANVLPVLSKAGKDVPFVGVACTPWDINDAYHILYQTGLFQRITTPILRFDPDGTDTFEDKPCFLTWPGEDGFNIEKVNSLRHTNSKAEFARMYLCDLESAKIMLYTWYSFPADEIDLKNPMGGGIDYASVWLPTNATEGGLSHFAISYLVSMANGTAVLYDGKVEKCTQLQAEVYTLQAQNLFPGWTRTVIEADGKGQEFAMYMMRNPLVRLIPMTTSQIFRGPKEKRQYSILSPLLETGALRVSDAQTPFLNKFRSYLENYPNIDLHAPEWDVADSVLWGVMALPTLSTNAKTTADAANEKMIMASRASPFNALHRS